MMKKAILPLLGLAVIAILAQPASTDPGRGTDVLCYLWANNSTQAIGVPYNPSSPYSYNSIGRQQANTVTRTAVGVYVATCKGVGGAPLSGVGGTGWGAGGHVQVTAYGGEDADQCKVVSWGTGGADFFANVRCYNHAGGLSDNRFDLLFVW